LFKNSAVNPFSALHNLRPNGSHWTSRRQTNAIAIKSPAVQRDFAEGRGPEGCVENEPAAALLVGYVQHQFDGSPRKTTRYLQTSNWCGAPSYRQSGSDRLADGPF
jgi:hypothetical protein